MSRYDSVDALQKYLAEEVFSYTESGKKAAGRALGTLVEIITFYLLESWGIRHSILIETKLPEYGNPEISHNVEYTIHPILSEERFKVDDPTQTISAGRIRRALSTAGGSVVQTGPSSNLLSRDRLLRNCCIIHRQEGRIVVGHMDRELPSGSEIVLATLHDKPYAMFECKRVGVEEGMKKGPQTIEKAKQGAYVAKTVSNLQKIRLTDGSQGGVLIITDQEKALVKKYDDLLELILRSKDHRMLGSFVLTVGVVSNHGNWFTSDNMNKETKILSQAYDWLLFLNDSGLADFINELIIHPDPTCQAASEAFLASYAAGKPGNRFTKTVIDFDADQSLHKYFNDNRERVASWFSVLAPKDRKLNDLRKELHLLRDKPWREILS